MTGSTLDRLTVAADLGLPTIARRLPGHRTLLHGRRSVDFASSYAATGTAATGAMPAEWIEQTLAGTFRALVELAGYRAGNVDPRRQRSLALGHRMERALHAGSSVGEIADAFGCSRFTVHRRLTDVAEHRATVSVFTARRTIRKPEQES